MVSSKTSGSRSEGIHTSVDVGTLRVNVVSGDDNFHLDKVNKDLDDMGDKSQDAGKKLDYSMGEARGSIMLTEEALGVRLPRHLNSLIAQIPGVGEAFAAMLPLVGVIAAITIITKLIDKHREMRDEALAAGRAETDLGTTGANALRALDDKMLELGIHVDETNHDHLAALAKALEVIDHQSLDELEKTFNMFDKAVDAVFAHLKASWYEMGQGSAGAKNALDDFKTKYDALLAAGKSGEAGDLLAGTLATAEKYKAMQTEMLGNQYHFSAAARDYNETHKDSVDISQKAVDAQDALIHGLQLQVDAEAKIAALKKMQGEAATEKANTGIEKDQDAAFKRQAESNKQEAEIEQRIWEEHYKEAVADLQESEKEKISATRAGSNERLAAIDAAIKEENAKGLQDTSFYRGLQEEKVRITEAMAEQVKRIQSQLGAEEEKYEEASAKITEKSAQEHFANMLKMRQLSIAQAVQAERVAAGELYNAEVEGLNKQLATLDRMDPEFVVKQTAINNKMLLAKQQYYAQAESITEKGEEQLYKLVHTGEERMADDISKTISKDILEHKNLAQSLEKTGEQMLETMLTNIIKGMLLQDMKKEHDASTAAADAFASAGNPILGAIMAAAAFTAVMAFAQGGEVPGHGSGDTVPAMLTPGETVVTKALTDQVKSAEGGQRGLKGITVNYNASASSFTSAGIKDVMEQHGKEFVGHLQRQLRKGNRG